MMKSDTISNLVTAMVAAKKEFQPVVKTETASIQKRNGGQFSYQYADLAAVIDATEPALLANGLVCLQSPTTGTNSVTVETTLAHTSGEFITETLTMPVIMDTPQSVGSAITYARRYAMMAVLGLAAQDDDGQAASAKKPVAKAPATQETTAPEAYTDFKLNMILAARSGMDALRKAWDAAKKEHKTHAREQDSEWWCGLKESCTTAVVA